MSGYLAMSITDAQSVAVHRHGRHDEPTVFVTDTVLTYAEDGTAQLGSGSASGQRTFTGFAGLVGAQGDDTQDDDYRAEDLVASSAYCLLASVTEQQSGQTPNAALTHPRTMDPDAVALLRDALDHVGLQGVALVPTDDADPVAAATGALVVIGAVPLIQSDSADTDALPVVAPQQHLAFSQAIPVQVPPLDEAPPDAEPTGRNSRPLVLVTGAAIAVILASVGIAAALGTFTDGVDVAPPAITDAEAAPTTSASRSPLPAAAVPLPTTIAPDTVVTLEPEVEPQPEPVAVEAPPAPAPAPAPPAPTVEPAPETAPPVTTPSVGIPTRSLPSLPGPFTPGQDDNPITLPGLGRN